MDVKTSATLSIALATLFVPQAQAAFDPPAAAAPPAVTAEQAERTIETPAASK